jgi:hypothetical protein
VVDWPGASDAVDTVAALLMDRDRGVITGSTDAQASSRAIQPRREVKLDSLSHVARREHLHAE